MSELERQWRREPLADVTNLYNSPTREGRLTVSDLFQLMLGLSLDLACVGCWLVGWVRCVTVIVGGVRRG